MAEDSQPFEWVPIGPEQAGDILALTRVLEEHDGTLYRTSFDEVLESFDPAYHWRAMAVRGGGGELVAYGGFHSRTAAPNALCRLSHRRHKDGVRVAKERRSMSIEEIYIFAAFGVEDMASDTM